MPVGSGGEGGSTGAGGDPLPMDRGISGGCACDTASSGSAPPGVVALAVMLGAWILAAARPRRQRQRQASPRRR
jgi:hypothetical protein